MWEEQYLKHTQPARVFTLERDAIEDYDADMLTDDDEEDPDRDFARIPFCEDSPDLATIRTRAYRDAWEACQSDIRNVLQELYNDTIAHLQSFVRNAPTQSRYRQRAIPTGVVLGANQTLSSALTHALEKVPPKDEDVNMAEAGPSSRPAGGQRILVARLSSRGCLNKRSALRSVIQAVISSDHRDEDAEVARRTTGKKLSMAATDDMETLVSWYESRYHSRDTAPRIAIYLEELESFDSAVLTDLIEILSTYAGRLPLVLLLAISTSISAIHTLLPRTTSERLRIASFAVTPSIETFHNLIFETFIKRNQVLTPSPKVFAFLRDTFLDLNQSIDGVISKLQYMFLAHFFGNPAAILCRSLPDDPELEDQLELLGNITPSLRALASVQRTVERSTEEALRNKDKTALRMTRQLLESDKELLRAVNAARRERNYYAAALPEAWTLFEVLQESWAEGRVSLETLLTEYFAGTMNKRTSTACRNLRNARDDVVLAFLRNTKEAFATQPTCPCELSEDLAQLEQLVETGTRQNGLTRLVNGNIQGSIAKSEGDKDFTKFVKNLSEKLDGYFKEHLKPFTELTFHEIWYPDVHRVLRSAFHPHILDQVQTSLVAPSSRLPLHLFDEDEALSTADDLDVCRAYNLVAGAGKIVNLADWFGAFELALDDVEKEEDDQRDIRPSKSQNGRAKRSTSKGKSRENEPNGSTTTTTTNGHHHDAAVADEGEESEDDELARIKGREARFLAAAADLAYLGFIQPTKRKAEHVARVVF